MEKNFLDSILGVAADYIADLVLEKVEQKLAQKDKRDELLEQAEENVIRQGRMEIKPSEPRETDVISKTIDNLCSDAESPQPKNLQSAIR